MDVAITTLAHFEGLQLPSYATPQSAGVDLRCAEETAFSLAPMARKAVKTGICLAIPQGFEGQVRPRSGLSLKQGISVVNAPGTIDADYRGEILVPLINFSDQPVTIKRGMRIAQLIFAPVHQANWQVVSQLDQTQRGIGGFGHTGSD